jgi:hypothetical protein
MLRPSKPRIHPAGDVLARIRFPPTASILVAYHSNLSNLIDAVVAPERIQRHGRCAGCNSDTTCGSCQDDDLVGHSDLQLTMMIAKRLLRRMVAASAVAYASRYPGLLPQLSLRIAKELERYLNPRIERSSASPHRPGCPNRHHLDRDHAPRRKTWS